MAASRADPAKITTRVSAPSTVQRKAQATPTSRSAVHESDSDMSCSSCVVRGEASPMSSPPATGSSPSTETSSSSHGGPQGVAPATRASLVDWMTSAAHKLHLGPDALFLSVALLDRFLQQQQQQPLRQANVASHLGLATAACLSLAVKFQTTAFTPLSAYLALMSCSFQPAHLAAAEVEVLTALDHKLWHVPNTYAHLEGLYEQLEAGGCPMDTPLRHMVSYLSELSLLEVQLLRVPHSHVAAACVVQALLLLRRSCSRQLLDALLAAAGCEASKLSWPLSCLAAVHATVTAAAGNGCPYFTTRKHLQPSRLGVAAVPPLLL